ncbi:hypothetical protein Poly51_01270 [Rubripirellula tenax]|uniref:DUF3035 domain-containing protein n=1 Tax=Rubripirellula tenax TaxID=2528015 RepID=A0A5C6FJG0_9BACT|nr:hypothetical protein [Rubripirellula tenax]TWU59854.1 hypothetical protein Poly51_01270 [Rubripirellula tenax]
MRNITLGVLIVAGGTLAALPFRRYQAISDDRQRPGAASGPTESSLDLALPEQVAQGDSGLHLPLPQSLPVWPRTERPEPLPREVNVPLSFDDLLVPIDQPNPIRQRFAATTDVHRDDERRLNAIALEMPPASEIAPEVQEELRRRLDFATPKKFENIAPKSVAGAAQGSLASAPWTASPPDRLPKPSPTTDARHWIRQP